MPADRAEKTAAELRGIGIKAYARDARRHQFEGRRRARRQASVKDHGRVDILVNNAGVRARATCAPRTPSDEHWRFHMDVNVDGVFWCCRAFGRHMLKQGTGSIVNIGSMSGFIVNKPQPQSFYNASKAAVHHLTKSLAAEWGAARRARQRGRADLHRDAAHRLRDQRSPEMYKTWLEMTPMGRVGQPDEIASVVHFLASDAASLLTGSIVLADGGYTCW